MSAYRDALLCVRGNCDTEVDQMVLPFPILSEFALVDTGRHIFCLTHGHKHGEDNPPPLRPGEILLCGHTHVTACRPIGENSNYYVNPGSTSIPKDGSPKSYILYNSADGSLDYRTLEGEEYRREMV